jgi:hypothetical protein
MQELIEWTYEDMAACDALVQWGAVENTKQTLHELVTNEAVHTNKQGGKQSFTPARFDLLPPEAIAQMALVLGQGAKKYGEENWRLIGTPDHVNHALQHIFSWLASGEIEDLAHAMCRVSFAVELETLAQFKEKQ